MPVINTAPSCGSACGSRDAGERIDLERDRGGVSARGTAEAIGTEAGAAVAQVSSEGAIGSAGFGGGVDTRRLAAGFFRLAG
ncbi:MAG: hypothetical protein AB8I08_09585, partial [Sandaracinaceae bacterium]